MPPAKERNPASQYALTIEQVRRLDVGTPLLVCRMNDYGADRRLNRPPERRIDQISHVVYRGSMPRPQSHRDTGTGDWVVLGEPGIEFGMEDMVVIKRLWRRPRYGYEPAILGLCPWPSFPGWTDTVCVVLPRHEKAIDAEYPRQLRSS